MKDDALNPKKEANRLTNLIKETKAILGLNRFPIDVKEIALGCANIYRRDDPITKFSSVSIPKFEGALYLAEEKSEWILLYNDKILSPGRIRFTQAHELGHYILHSAKGKQFECNSRINSSDPAFVRMESEADTFASYLLMPLDDFRIQEPDEINFDTLGNCADRYGVSLSAAIFKWLEFTQKKAIFICSCDGYIKWARSSDPAHKSGAYFKIKDRGPTEIPKGSLAANDQVDIDKIGTNISIQEWFSKSETDYDIVEMKIYSEQYDETYTLLLLPDFSDLWPENKPD